VVPQAAPCLGLDWLSNQKFHLLSSLCFSPVSGAGEGAGTGTAATSSATVEPSTIASVVAIFLCVVKRRRKEDERGFVCVLGDFLRVSIWV